MEHLQQKRDHSGKLLLPAVIVVALITQIPFLMTIILSTVKWNIKRPDQGISFNGINNYIDIFSDPNFWQVLLNTVIILISCLTLCTIIAILLGVLFNRNLFLGYFCRSIFIIPYFVMDCVVGIVWKTLLLNPSLGLNYYISRFFGFPPIDFFGQYSLMTIVILIVWQWTPFFFLIIFAGLQGVPGEILESAQIEGANGLQTLLQIQVPIIKSHINTAMTLGLINILKVFGLVYVTTQGGPGYRSANLPYLTYRTVFFNWSIGRAAALAVITVAITLFLTQKFFKATNKQ